MTNILPPRQHLRAPVSQRPGRRGRPDAVALMGLVVALLSSGCIMGPPPEWPEDTEDDTTIDMGDDGTSPSMSRPPMSPSASRAAPSSAGPRTIGSNPAGAPVTDVRFSWYSPSGGNAPTAVVPWQRVGLEATFTLTTSGFVDLVVRADVGRVDPVWVLDVKRDLLFEGTHTLRGEFDVRPDLVRSIEPALLYDDDLVEVRGDRVPRLPLSIAQGKADLVGVQWLRDGVAVNDAHQGDQVSVRVTIQAIAAEFVDEVTVQIRTDVAAAFDHDHVPARSVRLSVPQGQTHVFEGSFTATGGDDVRGFYIRIESAGRTWCGTDTTGADPCPATPKLLHQQEGYPPRLRLV